MSSRRSTPLGDYASFLEALVRHGVDFVVCGGVACILHGLQRVTADVDILVRMETGNLQRLVAAARDLGLGPRIPEPMEHLLDERCRSEWVTQKNATVYTFVSPTGPFQADVFLSYPLSYDEVASAADLVRIDNLTFKVSSKEHLIEAKQAVSPPRAIDRQDIEGLRALIDRERP